MVLGIDPGPTSCGVVLYDTESRRVVDGGSACSIDVALLYVGRAGLDADLVLIERVESYGQSGLSLLRTAEVCGRLGQAAVQDGVPVRLAPRRWVLSALNVSGKGNRDALVRARCIASHGGTRQAAQGSKAAPGPLYGVAGHAWQALGLVLAWCEGPPSMRDEVEVWG